MNIYIYSFVKILYILIVFYIYIYRERECYIYVRIANFDPFPESSPLSFVFAFDGVNDQEVFIDINGVKVIRW